MSALSDRLDRLEAKIDGIAKAFERGPAELLTPTEAADTLAICTKTLRQLIKRGELAKTQVGATEQEYRIARAEVQAYVARKTKGPAARAHRSRARPYDARAEADAIRRANGGRR